MNHDSDTLEAAWYACAAQVDLFVKCQAEDAARDSGANSGDDGQ